MGFGECLDRLGPGLKRSIGLAAICAALAACNTTPTMEIPVSADSQASATRAKTPLDTAGTEPIAFLKVVSGVRSGTVIAHFPANGVKGTSAGLCNYSYSGEATMTWTGAAALMGGWNDDAGIAFFDVLTGQGYDVTTDPDRLFEIKESISRARYHIAARVDDMRGNFCEEHHWWDGRPLDRYAGEFYVGVSWSVYDTLRRQEVAQFQSNGYYLHPKATTTGLQEAFRGAFAAAAGALADNADFAEAISGKAAAAETLARSEGSMAEEDMRELVLPAVGLFDRPFHEVSETVTGSVVTVRVGGGHGSGFVVGADGLILTNQHVVGESETVQVRFSSGLEMAAAVLRKSKVRDVALIKVPVSGLTPLPLKPGYPRIAEPVFAIGTPSRESLESTVTRGIVSAIRRDGLDGDDMPLIQADVTVHGGNSGGALVDEYGNVVGITVAGIVANGEAKASLNLFIPIGSALEHLNMTIAGAAPSS